MFGMFIGQQVVKDMDDSAFYRSNATQSMDYHYQTQSSVLISSTRSVGSSLCPIPSNASNPAHVQTAQSSQQENTAIVTPPALKDAG